MSGLHQKASYAILLGVGLAIMVVFASGCQTVDGQFYWPWETPQVDNARQSLMMQQAQRDAALSRNQLEGLTQSQRALQDRLDRLEAMTRDNAKMHDEILGLRKDIDQLRDEREAMRKQIVDDLTTRINQYMAKAMAGSTHVTAPATQTGRKHTVEAGQTLTDIAKAYKTTSSAIMKANSLKSSTLYAGQVLFIPVSE